MSFSLGRYLNVRRSERPRLAWLYGMLFASILGVIWGEAVIEAGFLRAVGVQYLPLAIICSALLSMGSITVYNVFADRISNQKLLVGILTLAATGIGAGILLLTTGRVNLAFPLLYIVDSALIRDMLNVHWSIYVNGFFDTQSAKRVFPVLSSASRVAAILAGLTMPLLNRAFPPAGIILLMLSMLAVEIILAVLMQRRLGDPRAPKPSAASGSKPRDAVAHLQEGYRYVSGSRYLRWIAVATFLMMVSLAYINYQSGRLLLANLKTVESMANFTALLSALGNLVALPLQLFLLNRLIARTGVGNAAMIYPTSSLLAVTGLTLVPGLITAAFGQITRSVLRTTFYLPVDGLLYNAVPLRVKARARGFVSGYVMTTGSVAGALLLMLNAKAAGVFLAVLFGALALAYFGSAVRVRREYGKAVVSMLEQEDFTSLLSPAVAELSSVDDATLTQLAARMAQPGASPDLKVFLAQVICQAGDVQAIPILDGAIRQAGDGRERARLLEVLAASGSDPRAAEAVFTACLADPEAEVRQAAIAGMERSTGDRPARFHNLVAPLLDDAAPGVRSATLSALVRSHAGGEGFGADSRAARVLESLLGSDDPQSRAQGVLLLGRLAGNAEVPTAEEYTSRLLGSFRDPADTIRLAALTAAEEAAGPPDKPLPEWLPAAALVPLISDPLERVRQGAARLLGRSAERKAQALLTDALADSSPAVRAAAAEGLAAAGPPVTDLVRPLLLSADPRLRSMSAAILARVDPAQYASGILSWCVIDHLQEAYRDAGYLLALQGGAAEPAVAAGLHGSDPAMHVLRCALSEQNAQLIEEIFYLLRAIRPAASVDRIAASLRSPDPRVRANSLEALEVLTTPQIARLLGPLCEPRPSRGQIFALSSAAWGWAVPSARQAIEALMNNREDPWLCELAAIADGSGLSSTGLQEDTMLSPIEKVIFLKEVPFFQGMTVEQLRVLAGVCEEEFFASEARLFKEGDPGGTLYVVVSGRVGIEQEKRKGSSVRLATVESHSYLGETDFFDNNCRTNSAIAIQDTLTLKLRREPLIALARQHPDLSLELINVLSVRLREANERIAELTRARPRELHKLYDQLG